MTDETRFSTQSRAVLEILRKEMEEGRIPADHAKFLSDAVKIKDSLGILGSFVVKFAGFLVAIGVAWSWWPRR